MVPIISIVGYSDTGKTTLVEKLVPELIKKGYRVGTVKHSDHEPEFDKKGKDSWRHFNAGADAVVAASADKIAIIRKNESRLKDSHAQLSFLSNYLTDMDVIIAEGFKHSKYPKIEVYRSVTKEAPLCKNNIIIAAIVTDADIQVDLPRFGLNEIEKISDFIVDNFL